MFSKIVTSTLVALLFVTAQANAKTELSFGLVQPVNSIQYRGAEAVAEKLEEVSSGQMVIKLYPSAQLGDDTAMLMQIKGNALDLTFANLARFGVWIPRAEVTGMPYVVRDAEHLKSIYHSEYGQTLREEMRTKFNWRTLDQWLLGYRHTTSNKPINSIEDMQGLKIRVPNVRANMDFVRNSGAAPSPMAFSEVYMALSTNAVDGQENPLALIDGNKFYEVQKNLALTGHIVNDESVIMSEARWNSLNDEQKAWLLVAVEAGKKAFNDEAVESEKALLVKFQQAGMSITRPDASPFRAAMKPVYEKFEKRVKQPGLIEMIQSI